jgi:hypothetical protein
MIVNARAQLMWKCNFPVQKRSVDAGRGPVMRTLTSSLIMLLVSVGILAQPIDSMPTKPVLVESSLNPCASVIGVARSVVSTHRWIQCSTEPSRAWIKYR